MTSNDRSAKSKNQLKYEQETRYLWILLILAIIGSVAMAGYEPSFASGATGLWIMLFGYWAYVWYARKERAKQDAELETTKVCPQCAERVLSAAKICKHCRHEFRD